jgi:hypothetical protein
MVCAISGFVQRRIPQKQTAKDLEAKADNGFMEQIWGIFRFKQHPDRLSIILP